jgi:hypothetical protein
MWVNRERRNYSGGDDFVGGALERVVFLKPFIELSGRIPSLVSVIISFVDIMPLGLRISGDGSNVKNPSIDVCLYNSGIAWGSFIGGTDCHFVSKMVSLYYVRNVL